MTQQEELDISAFMKEFTCDENDEYLHVPIFNTEDFIHYPKHEIWASTMVFDYEPNDIVAVACKEGMAITVSGVEEDGTHSIAFCRWFPESHAECGGHCEYMLECWAKYKNNDLSFEDGDFMKIFPLDLSDYEKASEPEVVN